MSAELRSVLTGTIGLSVLLGIATILTLSRPRLSSDPRARVRFMIILAVAVAAQTLHFVEELVTHFYERFPPLLGQAPWSTEFFITFNLFGLIVWALATFGVRAGWSPATLPIWFLGLAMVLNGVAHPLLSLRVGGYFPGLFTSPIVGVIGFVLLKRLAALTSDSRHS
jgi:hypothetical protein